MRDDAAGQKRRCGRMCRGASSENMEACVWDSKCKQNEMVHMLHAGQRPRCSDRGQHGDAITAGGDREQRVQAPGTQDKANQSINMKRKHPMQVAQTRGGVLGPDGENHRHSPSGQARPARASPAGAVSVRAQHPSQLSGGTPWEDNGQGATPPSCAERSLSMKGSAPSSAQPSWGSAQHPDRLSGGPHPQPPAPPRSASQPCRRGAPRAAPGGAQCARPAP